MSSFLGKELAHSPIVGRPGRSTARKPIHAALETPPRPASQAQSRKEDKHVDAFKELVALNNKQSVNRPQDVSFYCPSLRMRMRAHGRSP